MSKSRPDRKQARREDSEAATKAWRELSPKQQLQSLDGRLGKGVGAKRQRARIAKKLAEASKK